MVVLVFDVRQKNKTNQTINGIGKTTELIDISFAPNDESVSQPRTHTHTLHVYCLFIGNWYPLEKDLHVGYLAIPSI